MNSKKDTAAQRRRRIEAEWQRLQTLREPAPAMSPDLEQILTRYVPRTTNPDRWNDGMGDFVLDLVRRGQCAGTSTVRQLLSEVTLYVGWALDEGTDMTMDALLDHDLIERWVQVHTADASATTWLNRRSRLRNLASHVMPGPQAPQRPEPFGRRAVKAPYTLREVADLERLALSQPTASLRRQLCAMIGLGLGAGLSSIDLRYLLLDHVHWDLSGDYWVDVPGDRSRTVPVRACYVSYVQEALKGLKPGQLILGTEPARRGITTGVVDRAAIGTTSTVPDQARLRSTWILVAMTSPIPLAALLQTAGITTGSTLTDLLPYATNPNYVILVGGGSHDAL